VALGEVEWSSDIVMDGWDNGVENKVAEGAIGPNSLKEKREFQLANL